MNFSHILVTTDFSDTSTKAFDYAAYQAKMGGSKLTLINVFSQFEVPPELRRVIWNPERLRKMEEEYVSGSNIKLDEIAKNYFHELEIETVSKMSEKSPAEEICDYAKQNKCDLIVTSSHGRGAVESLFLGSVVQKILACAPCPVMVIR